MTPTINFRTLPANCSVYYGGRVIRMGVLHHTGRSIADPVPTPAGSWDRTFVKDGSITVWNDDPKRATFHTLNTLRWRPPAVAVCPDGRVSDANFSALGYEIQYDPDAGEAPNTKQLAAIRWQLAYDHARYGPIIWVGHGMIDSTKRPSEPTDFDYEAVGLRMVRHIGFMYRPPQEEEMIDPISVDDFKGYLEIYGFGANPETAIFKRLHQAYQRGERRGPLLSDEYEYTIPATDGTPERTVIRQRCTAATIEYDPTTGGIGFVELNLNPEVTP